ncbi:MAG: ribonuclease III [Oscillospiraceae bacterium]|nr:ribonuclease III [Oscillospiraceae bacterium]
MENLFALSFSKNQINEMSSLGLAHIGDAVYELLCRSYLCCSGHHTVKNLHKDTISLVNAQAQAVFAQKLLPFLNEEEQGWFRRGKNAHSHAPKSASPKEYALATGLEALFGALYLAGRTDRLRELFSKMLEKEQIDN